MSKKRQGHKRPPKKPQSKSKINGARPRKIPLDELLERVAKSNSTNGTGNGRERVIKARGGDSGRLLTDQNRIGPDARLIERAVRNRWGVRRKGLIRRRLEDIVAHEQTLVLSKDGPEISMSEADRNAIAASRVLVAMNGQDQADDFEEAKAATPQLSPVNVHIDARTSQIIQLAKQLGARTLLIDGAEVSVEQGTGKPSEAGAVPIGSSKSVVRNAALAKAADLLESDL